MRRSLLLVLLAGCGYDFGGGSPDDGAQGGAPGASTAITASASAASVTGGGPATAASSGAGGDASTSSTADAASSSATGQPEPVVPTCGQADDFDAGLDAAIWDWSWEANGSVEGEDGVVKMRAGNQANDYAGITAKAGSPTECAFVVRLVSGEASVSVHQDDPHFTALGYFGTMYGGFSGAGQFFASQQGVATPTHLGLVMRDDRILGMAKDDAGWHVIFDVAAPDWTGNYRPTAYVYGNNQQGVIDDYGIEPILESDLIQ